MSPKGGNHIAGAKHQDTQDDDMLISFTGVLYVTVNSQKTKVEGLCSTSLRHMDSTQELQRSKESIRKLSRNGNPNKNYSI